MIPCLLQRVLSLSAICFLCASCGPSPQAGIVIVVLLLFSPVSSAASSGCILPRESPDEPDQCPAA
jgi:hypothetical protein